MPLALPQRGKLSRPMARELSATSRQYIAYLWRVLAKVESGATPEQRPVRL